MQLMKTKATMQNFISYKIMNIDQNYLKFCKMLYNNWQITFLRIKFSRWIRRKTQSVHLQTAAVASLFINRIYGILSIQFESLF